MSEARAVLGSGEYAYTPDPAWGSGLPPGIVLGNVAAVAVDAEDNVYLFNRGPHPMVVTDRHGTFLRSCIDGDGWVYVADRENHRIQVFDLQGRYERQIGNLHRTSALALIGRSCPVCVVGEIGPYMSVNRRTPNLGPRISFVTHEGTLLSRLAVDPPAGVGQFLSPHGLALDSRGDLYVGEVSARAWPSLFPEQAVPEDLPRMRKLVRTPAAAAA